MIFMFQIRGCNRLVAARKRTYFGACVGKARAAWAPCMASVEDSLAVAMHGAKATRAPCMFAVQPKWFLVISVIPCWVSVRTCIC